MQYISTVKHEVIKYIYTKLSYILFYILFSLFSTGFLGHNKRQDCGRSLNHKIVNNIHFRMLILETDTYIMEHEDVVCIQQEGDTYHLDEDVTVRTFQLSHKPKVSFIFVRLLNKVRQFDGERVRASERVVSEDAGVSKYDIVQSDKKNTAFLCHF